MNIEKRKKITLVSFLVLGLLSLSDETRASKNHSKYPICGRENTESIKLSHSVKKATLALITTEYPFLEGIDVENLPDGRNKLVKLLRAILGDKYLNICEKKIESKENLRGEILDIGAKFKKNKAGNFIIKGFRNISSGRDAGLKIGDEILMLNGESIKDKSHLFQAIRSSSKKNITVKFRRDKKEYEGSIKKLRWNSVELNSYKGYEDYPVLTIYKFTKYTGQDILSEMKRQQDKTIKGMVIDIYSNGGGSLKGSMQSLDVFIKKGELFDAKVLRTGERTKIQATDNNYPWENNLKIVVMASGKTASASELFLGAMLKNHSDVKFIGDETYGKNVGQGFRSIDAHYQLGLTMVRFKEGDSGYSPHQKEKNYWRCLEKSLALLKSDK